MTTTKAPDRKASQLDCTGPATGDRTRYSSMHPAVMKTCPSPSSMPCWSLYADAFSLRPTWAMSRHGKPGPLASPHCEAGPSPSPRTASILTRHPLTDLRSVSHVPYVPPFRDNALHAYTCARARTRVMGKSDTSDTCDTTPH